MTETFANWYHNIAKISELEGVSSVLKGLCPSFALLGILETFDLVLNCIKTLQEHCFGLQR